MVGRRLSAKEHTRRRELGLCMYCGGGDHRVDACAKLRARQRSSTLVPILVGYHRDAPKLDGLLPVAEVHQIQEPRELVPPEYESAEGWLRAFGPGLSRAFEAASPEVDLISLGPLISNSPSDDTISTAPQAPSSSTTAITAAQVLQAPPRPNGLFDLPRELRDKVYFATIRPDCRLQFKYLCKLHHDCVIDVNGCTNLFVLSSKVYCESIEILHAHEHLMTIKPNKASLFKSMKDFPYPNVFKSSKYGFTPYLPTGFCELHFLRFRKVAIGIEMPGPVPLNSEAFPGYLEDVNRLGNKLMDFSAVMQKSQHLQTLRIMIRREGRCGYVEFGLWSFYRSACQDGATNDGIDLQVKKLLRPLLDLAHSKDIKVSAEEHRIYSAVSYAGGKQIGFKPVFGDPLLAWINAMTPLALRALPAFTYHMDVSVTTVDDLGQPTTMQHVCEWRSEKNPNTFIEEEEDRFKSTFGKVQDPEKPYELVPECRTCHALLGSWNDLKAHLDQYPKHAKKYKAKKCNEVCSQSDFGGRIKCVTCAYEPEGIKKLDQHLERTGHRWWGIVPRWKEDNIWYDQRDRHRLEKKGGGPPLWVKPYYGT